MVPGTKKNQISKAIEKRAWQEAYDHAAELVEHAGLGGALPGDRSEIDIPQQVPGNSALRKKLEVVNYWLRKGQLPT